MHSFITKYNNSVAPNLEGQINHYEYQYPQYKSDTINKTQKPVHKITNSSIKSSMTTLKLSIIVTISITLSIIVIGAVAALITYGISKFKFLLLYFIFFLFSLNIFILLKHHVHLQSVMNVQVNALTNHFMLNGN